MKRVKYPTPGVLPSPTKPFVSINVEKDDNGKIKIIAQIFSGILVDKDGKGIEGAEFGLALDGSKSMETNYGTSIGPFGGGTPNLVEPVAKGMINFLADYSGKGKVNLAFWAVGPEGKDVEEIGLVGQESIDNLTIKPKSKMGGQTYLLPIVKYFVDNKLKDAKWAMAIIVTDGLIDDMEDVKEYCEKYAVDIDSGKRNLVKLVLIGLGKHIDIGQLEELDNFEPSVDVDIWSSKVAAEMKELTEVFDEVMTASFSIANSGKIIDNNGKVLATYNDGLPAKIEFTLNKNSTAFKLEVPGQSVIEQDLSEALARLT